MENYHHFSESAFPVLIWIKSGCKKSYIPISNSSDVCPFNRKTYIETALIIISDYKRTK